MAEEVETDYRLFSSLFALLILALNTWGKLVIVRPRHTVCCWNLEMYESSVERLKDLE